MSAGRGHDQAICRWGNPSADPGKRAWRGRVSGAADLLAGGSPFNGAATAAGCSEARERGAHYRSVTLLWVRATGPERPAAHADFGKIGGQPARNGGSKPGSGAR